MAAARCLRVPGTTAEPVPAAPGAAPALRLPARARGSGPAQGTVGASHPPGMAATAPQHQPGASGSLPGSSARAGADLLRS